MPEVGRMLLVIGGICLVLGAVLTLGGKIPGGSWLGRLPGDLIIDRPRLRVYLPLGSCLLASVVLTLILSFFRR